MFGVETGQEGREQGWGPVLVCVLSVCPEDVSLGVLFLSGFGGQEPALGTVLIRKPSHQPLPTFAGAKEGPSPALPVWFCPPS